MDILFNISFAFCLLALVMAFAGLFTKNKLVRRMPVLANMVAAAMLAGYMGVRWGEAGRAPFSNMFESLVLFAWTIMVVYIFVQKKLKFPLVTAASALLVVLTLAFASLKFDSEIRPLVPALQSNWLAFHVFTCFQGYGGFAISFLAAIPYLVLSSDMVEVEDEILEALETTVANTTAFGFLFLTIGIISGSVWANSAWGTYWSWDPKETWSLITWLIYAGFLHCRFIKDFRGRASAWISIVGFVSVLFTYFGVNYLLKGLHSYL